MTPICTTLTQPAPINFDHLFRSQFGEDRILWQIFRHRRSGYFMEIGAYDGVNLSNTYFLEQMGWHGVLVEPIEDLCLRAAAARPKSRVIQAAVSRKGSQGTAKFTITQNVPVLSYLNADQDHVERCLREGATLIEIEVPLLTVDDIIRHERSAAPPGTGPWVPNVGWTIDLVSIDVEGGELDVLDGFNLERYKPRILLIENDRPAGDGIEPHLSSRGYKKFHRQKINDFYAHVETSADLMLEGFSQ